MNIAAKFANFGQKDSNSLEEFQLAIQLEMIELKDRIRKKAKEIVKQRNVCLDQEKLFNDSLIEEEKRKLEALKEEQEELQTQYKDNLETVKTIEAILKIREEKKTAKANRWYSGIGTFAIVGGIGLAYGSDTFSTLINKHTMDAVKMAITRYLPKIV